MLFLCYLQYCKVGIFRAWVKYGPVTLPTLSQEVVPPLHHDGL